MFTVDICISTAKENNQSNEALAEQKVRIELQNNMFRKYLIFRKKQSTNFMKITK